MTLRQRGRGPEILHSDQGCTYSAAGYRQLLGEHGIRQSMSTKRAVLGFYIWGAIAVALVTLGAPDWCSLLGSLLAINAVLCLLLALSASERTPERSLWLSLPWHSDLTRPGAAGRSLLPTRRRSNPGHADKARQGLDALDPAAHAGVGIEPYLALGCECDIREAGDVRDRHVVEREPLMRGQPLL